MTQPVPRPYPAEILSRKLSAICPDLVPVARDVAAKGLIEYGQYLTVDSHVIVKRIVKGDGDAPDTVEESREPLTVLNALDNAVREGIDAASYAIAAQQKHAGGSGDVEAAIALGCWQIMNGLKTLHDVASNYQ